MPAKHPLYFIAILPPPEIQDEVTAFKAHIAATWGPGHALKSPPHLTLFPPFAWPDSRLEALANSLADFAKIQSPMELTLNGFQAFPPRVVFVCPVKNQQLEDLFHALVRTLHNQLGLHDERNRRPFHPHMTIAHRDVDALQFRKIWDFYRSQHYERVFSARSIALLVLDHGRWKVWRSFPMR